MKKYYVCLVAALWLLTSCGQEPEVTATMPMSRVPWGIEILALIGLVTVIVLLIGFILFFGGIIEYFRNEE